MKLSSSGIVQEDERVHTVVPEESAIEAVVFEGKLFWRIEIRTIANTSDQADRSEEVDEDEDECDDGPLDGPSMDLTFCDTEIHNLQELSNRQLAIDWGDEPCPAILPGHPALVALSYTSLFAHHNELTFGKVRDFAIELNWHCIAADPEIEFDPPLKYEFDFSGKLKMKGVVIDYHYVYGEELQGLGGACKTLKEFNAICDGWQPDYDDALQKLQQFFDPADFEAPERGLFTVIFPVRSK